MFLFLVYGAVTIHTIKVAHDNHVCLLHELILVIGGLYVSVIEKNKFQTKQKNALRNRTESVIHASVPCFPDVCSFLANDLRDWIDHAQLPGVMCLWPVVCTYWLCIWITVFCLKFIYLFI